MTTSRQQRATWVRSQDLNAFLFSSLLFALVVGAWQAFELGLVGGLAYGVVGGAVLGGIVTLALATVHRRGVKRQLPQITDVDLNVRQRRTVRLSLPPSEALEVCKSAIRDVVGDQASIRFDQRAGCVAARTGASWSSWGEVLQLEVAPSDQGSVVTISSGPRVALNVYDAGKNLRNVRRIEHLVRSSGDGHGALAGG